ncbi:MAG: copper resistance D family protein, partial [Anaerolineales bacterium]
ALIDPTPWRRMATVALSVLLAAHTFGLLVHAGQATGAEIAAPWSAAVGDVLSRTRFGALWIARLALALALAGLLPRTRSARERWVAFGVSTLLLLTVSLGSHAAAEPRPLWPVLADWVHLVAASVWVGGLTHFVAGLWAMRRSGAEGRAIGASLQARLIPRFSALAVLSVGVLTLTGLYSSLLRVGTLAALTNTAYGRTLIFKLLIALAMVGLGAVNLFVVTSRMKRAAQRAEATSLTPRFRRIVTSEVALGAALLLSVGLLTSLPPARVTAPPPGLQASAAAEDLRLSLTVTPGRVGVNTFTLRVTSNGLPVDAAKEVALRFTPAAVNVPPSEVQLAGQGNGEYSVRGAYLSLPDNWQVQAVVRREGQFDVFANFNFDLRAGSTAQAFPW